MNWQVFKLSSVTPTTISDIFIAVLLLSAVFTAAIIPPFQSPDEFDHIKRAYLLSKAKVTLDAPIDDASGLRTTSGGMIDTGLLSYMAIYTQYTFKPDRKVSLEAVARANKISWSGLKIFSGAPGTGYYFPIIYAPQALGLAIGEALSLTIDASYRLARLSTIFITILLLFIAFRLFNPPIVVMGLLILPMSLFQISSASLDGISNATAILGISAFARFVLQKPKACLLWILSATVLIVASSRAHLVAMLTLVFGTFFYTKEKKSIFAGLFLSFALATWILLAVNATVDLRVAIGLSTSELLAFYANNPLSLIEVLRNTFSHFDLLKFYAESFIGILGWLDAPFREGNYHIFYALIIFALVASVRLHGSKGVWGARALLLAGALGSALIVFLALLITWTPHPASVVLGVQGRYFFVPIVMLACALCFDNYDAKPGFRYSLGVIVLAVLNLYSVFVTTRLLLERYYLV
jgi:uncharacterized membrane protein